MSNIEKLEELIKAYPEQAKYLMKNIIYGDDKITELMQGDKVDVNFAGDVYCQGTVVTVQRTITNNSEVIMFVMVEIDGCKQHCGIFPVELCKKITMEMPAYFKRNLEQHKKYMKKLFSDIDNSEIVETQRLTKGDDKTRFITVKDWIKYHNWPPIGGLRNLIFNKEKNGFNKVVKKVGKRVLIDENAFFEWVESQN